MKQMRRDHILWLACLGNIYFWFIGQLLQQSVIEYGENVLKIGEVRTTYLLAAMAIGIGLGSFAAGYLSGGKIEYGLVPLGSLGICIFAAVLTRPTLSFGQILGTIATLGFFGGFFIVPISAILQHRPAKQERGRCWRPPSCSPRRACSWLRASIGYWQSGCTWVRAASSRSAR